MRYPQTYAQKRWLGSLPKAVTIAESLTWAETRIKSWPNPEARLEAEVLLCHTLGISRARLYASLADELPQERWDHFQSFVQRRSVEPAAYITNVKEFYGREFYVDYRVLVPRPETETLVEVALAIAHNAQERLDGAIKIADIGTGSGVIAITLALALPGAGVYATDISPEALQVAAINCASHGASERIALLQGDLVDPLPEQVDLMVANLPYLTEDQLQQAGNHWSTAALLSEPAKALHGGPDGLQVIRRLIAAAPRHLRQGGALVLEMGCSQGAEVLRMAERYFPGAGTSLHRDLAGFDRVVSIETESREAGSVHE